MTKYAPNPYEDPRCQETDSPWERIFRFFRQRASGAVILWQRVLTGFLSAGAAITWRPQTLMEGLPPSPWRWQRAGAWFSAPSKRICTLVPSFDVAAVVKPPAYFFSPAFFGHCVTSPRPVWRLPLALGPRVSNDLLSVRARTPVTRFSMRLSTQAGRPG
jgi:hypothetical protein